jgi:hypothetical protein
MVRDISRRANSARRNHGARQAVGAKIASTRHLGRLREAARRALMRDGLETSPCSELADTRSIDLIGNRGGQLGMIYPFNRKTKFEKLLADLKSNVLGRTTGFAADVAEEIDRFAAQKLFGLSSETPSYARQFSCGPPKSSTTHINQMVLFVGALSFFWHAIDRFSYRPNNEALRAAVLDPIVVSLSEMLAEALNKKGVTTTANDTLLGVQALSLRYAEASTLMGTSAKDKNCALWLAARAIVQDAGLSLGTATQSEALVSLMMVNLSENLVALDLANRIKALEVAL